MGGVDQPRVCPFDHLHFLQALADELDLGDDGFWGRLAPDHKTIADFRKENGRAIRQVCARFVELCRIMGLLTEASVAIDGNTCRHVEPTMKMLCR